MGNNGDNNGEPMEESWSSGFKDLRSQILDLRSDPGATWSSNKHEQKQKKHYQFNIFSLVLQKRNKKNIQVWVLNFCSFSAPLKFIYFEKATAQKYDEIS